MSLNTLMASDLPGLYKTLADAKAMYESNAIDVFFEDDYDIEGVSDRTIKAQARDVINIAVGQTIVLQAKSYKVLNFNFSDDALETIIMLNKVS